jgi:Ca-activated chloride channel family protein
MDPNPVETLPVMGEMVLVSETNTPLPLEHTAYSGQILGPVATLAVVQRFRNPLDEAAELVYLFPLSHAAAILDFELAVGGRTIRADLRELQQARQQYEQARQGGRRAGLLEERRANLFAVRLANVLPGESLQATIRCQERLSYHDGEYELVIPMGLTPRYHSPGHPWEGAGLDAPIARPEEAIGGVEILLSVDAGCPAGDPVCSTHPIEFTRLDERRFSLRLSGDHAPDHDFVLRYTVAQGQPVLAAWRATDPMGDYFLATLLPPALGEAVSPPPREFIFVLDRSGSMSGEPLAQAVNALRACLRTLGPDDRFRILLFNDQIEWYLQESSPVTQASIEQADRFLAQVEGRGGTEIVAALSAALTRPPDPQRLRLVVFLTDGAVSAEGRALERVYRQLGMARLFTFGIGPAVNRALLQRLARLGSGTSEFLGLQDDIEGAILRFQDHLAFPALTNLSLSTGQSAVWDVYPSPLRDLYYEQPLEIGGRVKTGEVSLTLAIQGHIAGNLITMTVDLPPASQADPVIARLWAHARIDDLLEQEALGIGSAAQARAEIISLALEHRLVTPYTAFVAVDSEVAAEGGQPRLVQISQPLPPGLKLEGFAGQAPVLAASPGHILYQTAHKGLGEARQPAAYTVMASASLPPSAVDDAPLKKAEEIAQGEPEVGIITDELRPAGREAILRWLARTQMLDGSWQGDVEMTAAALLAFVRLGHTSQAGSYRRQVSKATSWLNAAAGIKFAGFLRALALHELAQATAQESHRQMAQEAARRLPPPTTELERTVLAVIHGPAPIRPARQSVRSQDDLRWAVITRAAVAPIPAQLFRGSQANLLKALAAAANLTP